MSETDYVADVLGGASIARERGAAAGADLRTRIRSGLPYRSFESFRERLGLSVPEAASVLRMAPRTLARRRQARRLDADESDRLYRIARIAGRAYGVFGTEEKAAEWLRRPNRALDGETPLRALDTDLGARLVEDVLGRIEHGIIG